jgi:hypothetical protein
MYIFKINFFGDLMNFGEINPKMANASGLHSVFNFSSHLGSSDCLLPLNINETNFEIGNACGFFWCSCF